MIKNLFLIKIKNYALKSELLLNEKKADRVEVSLVHDSNVSKVSLCFLGLLSQDVTLVSMFSFNLSCSGKGKSFFGTGISLNFWHFFVVI